MLHHTPSRCRRRLLAVVLAMALLAACSGDDGDAADADSSGGLGALMGGPGDDAGPVTPAALDEPGEWTVFVYLAADNDLEPFALDDLGEMASTTGVKIVALIDRHGGYTDADALGLGDFEDTRLVRIEDGEVEVLSRPGELDTGDPAVLADFLADGLAEHGSERNGLVIWNHGGAWPGAAVDETSGGTMLSVEGISGAIADGLARSGTDRLDLVGFDACLMATYEVAVNLAPVADTLLASEELEPGHGWDWSALSADGPISTSDLARGVLDGFAAQAEQYSTTGVTLSLVDLTRLDGLDAAFASMAEAVDANAVGLAGRISSSRTETLGFGRHPDPAYDTHMVDIGHLAENLAAIDGLEAAAAELSAAIDDAVVMHITDHTTVQSQGLAVYFPPVASLGDPRYEQLDHVDPWTEFLASYYTGAEGIPSEELPAFLDEDRYLEDGDVEHSDDELAIAAAVVGGTGSNVASAKLYWGQVDMDDTDLVAFYGERPATIDGDTISASYDWRYLVLTDGSTTATAYSQLDVDESGELRRIVVPLTYIRNGSSLRAVLVLGVAGGSVVSETFYGYAESGAVGEIQPNPGDEIVPRLLVQDLADFSSEWVDSSAAPLSAMPDQLEQRLRRLAPATPVMLELGLTDLEGGTDYVFHGTASP